MPKDSDKPSTPPYVSYASFKSFINGLGESTVPSRIDKSVMSNYSGSTQYQLHPALHWLGLIDANDRPNDLLSDLSVANDEDFGKLLAPLVREKYYFLFSDEVDLKTASSGQVEEAFKSQGVSGSTVTKCISFFLRIAAEAKIPISPHVKAPTVKRKSTANRQRRQNARRQQREETRATTRNPEMEEFVIPIRNLPDGSVSLPKDLDEDGAIKALRIIKFNLEQYYDIEIDE